MKRASAGSLTVVTSSSKILKDTPSGAVPGGRIFFTVSEIMVYE